MIGNNFIKFLAAIFLVLISCSSKNDRRQNGLVESKELLQISLSTDGRKEDTTGGFAIELNRNFSVNYYGGSQSDLAGNYVSKIDSSDWNHFLKLVSDEQIKDTVLSKSSFEDNYFDLSIKFRHKEYYITGFYSNAPQYIKEICELVLSTKKKLNFTKAFENKLFKVKAYKVKQKYNANTHFTIPEVK